MISTLYIFLYSGYVISYGMISVHFQILVSWISNIVGFYY